MTKQNKGTLLIMDLDSLVFQVGWAFKDQLNLIGAAAARKATDKTIEYALRTTGATHYIGFYGQEGGRKTFRHEFATLRIYKGQRKSDEWSNFFRTVIKDHFRDKWNAYGLLELEADDAITVAYEEYKDDYKCIIYGQDKDMLQMAPFVRFNNIKRMFEGFKREEGRKLFWSQCLHGDTGDNIEGIPGVGSGKKGGITSKNKIVQALWAMEDPSEEEMFEHVQEAYINKFGENYLYHLVENYILLYMVKKPCMDYPKNPVLQSFTVEERVETAEELLDL